MKNAILSIGIILSAVTLSVGQVTGVKFLIEYNEGLELFDAKMVITEGNATSYIDRVQFNGQYTIVVPAGAGLQIDTLYQPIEDNSTYEGTIPCLWEISISNLSPQAAPDREFYAVSPNIVPISAYNNISEGDTITLFSFYTNVDPCTEAENVRPFDEDLDPTPIEFYDGGDYTCGTLIGGGLQDYTGNLYSEYGQNYIFSSTGFAVCPGKCITLEVELPCFMEDVAYEWSTGEYTSSIEVCPTVPTDYYVQILDSEGNVLDSLGATTQELLIDISASSYEVCTGDVVLLEGCPSSGVWSENPTNGFGASLTGTTGTVEAHFSNFASGSYDFIYSVDTLHDTLSIIVHPKPLVNLNMSEVCIGMNVQAAANISGGEWSSNNPSITYINPESGLISTWGSGMATFNYTDENGCIGTTTTLTIKDLINAEFNGPDSVCVGGVTTLSPTTGGSWTSDDASIAVVDNSGNVTGISSGTAGIVYTSSENGCQSNIMYITVYPEPAELAGPNTICVGGTTNLIPTEGGNWISSNPVVATINNNGTVTAHAVGSAYMAFTNSTTGCQSRLFNITVNDVPIVSIEDNVICEGETTQLLSSINGTWTSNNPDIAVVQSNGSVSTIAPGVVGFSFEAENGCSTETDPDILTALPAPTTQLVGPDEICVGGTTQLEPTTGGTWMSQNDATATITNSGLVTGTGEGQVKFIFTDTATGCESEPSEEVTVTYTVSPPNIQTNQPICAGEDIQLSTDNVTGATYRWNGPNGFTSNDQNPIIPNASLDAQGTYSVHIIVDGCYSLPSTSFIGVYDTIPPLNLMNNGPFCVGQEAILAAEYIPNATYMWTGPNGFTSNLSNVTFAEVSFLDAGEYCVVASLGGCESIASCTFLEVFDEMLPPAVSYNGPICEGQTLELYASDIENATYFWVGPAGYTSYDQNPVIPNAALYNNTTFCVEVSQGDCTSMTECIEVVVNPLPATPETSNNGPICEGETIELSSDLITNAFYVWTGPNGYSSGVQNPSIFNADPSNSGQYCVVVYVDGCESMEACTEMVVNPKPAPPQVVNNGPLCEGETIQLSTPAVTGATYAWTGPNGFTSSDQNPSIQSANSGMSGSYCVIVTVDGCESMEACVDVDIIPTPATPIFEVINNPICVGDDIEFETDLFPGSNYQWTGPNGFTSNNQNPVIPNASVENTGLYCLQTEISGCQSEEFCIDISVIESPTIEVISNNSQVCFGESLLIEIKDIPGATYSWSGPDGTQFPNEPILSILNPEPSQLGILCVTVDLFGCSSEECFDVIVYPNDEAPTISSNSPICIGSDILLETEEIPAGIYEWTGPNGFFSDQQNPIIQNATAENSGTYTLRAYNPNSLCPFMEAVSTSIEVSSCIEPFAACDEIGPDDIICDFDEFASIIGTFPESNISGNQPEGELCFSNDGVQNISWYSFVALEGDYEIVIKTYNCQNENGENEGSQTGVYTDCSFSLNSRVFCSINHDFSSDPIHEDRVSSDLLIPGEVYYIYLDGFQGSICNYSIHVEGFYDNTYCTDLSKVTGYAYVDENENGIFDQGETPLRNALISLSPGNFSVLTNDEGKYIINMPKGGATLTATMYDGHWIENVLTIEDLSVFETCVEGINFGFVPNLFYQEANVSVVNSITRCDWETYFYFTVENTGTIDLNGKVEFVFDYRTTYFDTNADNIQVNGNSANIDIGTIAPFEVHDFWIRLKMPSGSAVQPILDFKTTLFNSADLVMDEFEKSSQLRCSYDPNDKSTFPDREGDENLTLMEEDLEYTIRFQNNGNDTAFLVKIIDPLDSNIDPTSIRVINSSHDVETCIENNNLIFIFEDIYLVDSMTNYDGSQGFISYRCSTVDGVLENTVVHNTADIIFDSNAPIVTNTTVNTLVSVLCTDIMTEIDVEICEGEEYNGNTESGIYTESYPIQYGCDSIVTVNLMVQGITYSAQEIEICEGEAFELNEEDYILYESQEIRDTVYNEIGCISNVFIFDVMVYPIQHIEIDTTICEGMDYDGYTESGAYTIDSFDVLTGCDIITTINLEVLPISDPACITNVEELDEGKILLYPNPVRDRFYLETEHTIDTISIYSLSAQKANMIPIPNGKVKLEISTDGLSSGLYIVSIYTNGKMHYKKLVVE